jgi:hypothetical protein
MDQRDHNVEGHPPPRQHYPKQPIMEMHQDRVAASQRLCIRIFSIVAGFVDRGPLHSPFKEEWTIDLLFVNMRM